MFRANPVMAAQQPRIKVPEYDVDHRQVGSGLCLIAFDGHRIVAIAMFGEVVVASPAISADG